MHSIYQNKIIKCPKCGAEFGFPLLDTYKYENIIGYPKMEVGYCEDCKKYVAVQKGIKYNEVKHNLALKNLLKGRNSKDACVLCGRSNISKSSLCPNCKESQVVVVDENYGIAFHFNENKIFPVLDEFVESPIEANKPICNKPKSNIKEVSYKVEPSGYKEIKNKEDKNRFLDIVRWISILPLSILSWLISYWVINLLYNVFAPVDMSTWAITLMSSGGSGFAFVYLGSAIAPRGKKVVSVVLATIMGIIALANLVFAFYGYGNNSIISIIACLSTFVGCIYGSVITHEDNSRN